MNLLQRIKQHLGQRGLFVIADPIDNSITFSKQLFQHIQHNNTMSFEFYEQVNALVAPGVAVDNEHIILAFGII